MRRAAKTEHEGRHPIRRFGFWFLHGTLRLSWKLSPAHFGPTFYVGAWLVGLAVLVPFGYWIANKGIGEFADGSRWPVAAGIGLVWTVFAFRILPKEAAEWNDDQGDHKGSE